MRKLTLLVLLVFVSLSIVAHADGDGTSGYILGLNAVKAFGELQVQVDFVPPLTDSDMKLTYWGNDEAGEKFRRAQSFDLPYPAFPVIETTMPKGVYKVRAVLRDAENQLLDRRVFEVKALSRKQCFKNLKVTGAYFVPSPEQMTSGGIIRDGGNGFINVALRLNGCLGHVTLSNLAEQEVIPSTYATLGRPRRETVFVPYNDDFSQFRFRVEFKGTVLLHKVFDIDPVVGTDPYDNCIVTAVDETNITFLALVDGYYMAYNRGTLGVQSRDGVPGFPMADGQTYTFAHQVETDYGSLLCSKPRLGGGYRYHDINFRPGGWQQ